jgi:hypothetical protein
MMYVRNLLQKGPASAGNHVFESETVDISLKPFGLSEIRQIQGPDERHQSRYRMPSCHST